MSAGDIVVAALYRFTRLEDFSRCASRCWR